MFIENWESLCEYNKVFRRFLSLDTFGPIAVGLQQFSRKADSLNRGSRLRWLQGLGGAPKREEGAQAAV